MFARLMQQARVQRDQQAALARLAQNGAEQPAQPLAAPTPSNGAEHGNDQSAQPPAPPTTGSALLEMLLQHRAGNVPQATVTALPQEGPNPTSALPRPPSEQPARPPAPVTTSNMVECSICCGPPMSRFTKGAINTPCGHCFHRQCLGWRKAKRLARPAAVTSAAWLRCWHCAEGLAGSRSCSSQWQQQQQQQQQEECLPCSPSSALIKLGAQLPACAVVSCGLMCFVPTEALQTVNTCKQQGNWRRVTAQCGVGAN